MGDKPAKPSLPQYEIEGAPTAGSLHRRSGKQRVTIEPPAALSPRKDKGGWLKQLEPSFSLLR